jgi:hypothetical protein
VDKTKLPDVAFADRAGRRFPHHWVQNGGDPDEKGRYTTGTLLLHRGGLNAAWSAAHGARSGEKADQAVISHLEMHRKALGLDAEAPKDEGMAAAPAEAASACGCTAPCRCAKPPVQPAPPDLSAELELRRRRNRALARANSI